VNAFRGKILVIRGGAIGDFILTLPVLAALRAQFPRAHLEVLGYPHIVQLALAGGLADQVHSIDARPLAGFFARGGELAEDLIDYFSEFDLVVSYLYDPDEIFRTNVGRCTRAQFIAGPHRPDEKLKVHATKVYLKPLERLAIFDADPVPRLSFNSEPGPEPAASGAEPNLKDVMRGCPIVALHPGSGSERKNWPEGKWADFLQYLVNITETSLLLVGGEAEGDRLQNLAADLPPSRLRVARSLPLVELARLLSQCDAFVGHDSGISHLAAAVGLPGLVLWGESDEDVWRPPSERVNLLRHPAGLPYLPVSRVASGLEFLLLV